jgi:hypothetical protein
MPMPLSIVTEPPDDFDGLLSLSQQILLWIPK